MRKELCDAIEAERFTLKQGLHPFDNVTGGGGKEAGRLTGRLWNCPDTAPQLHLHLVQIPQASTHAQLARMIREQVPAAQTTQGRRFVKDSDAQDPRTTAIFCLLRKSCEKTAHLVA
jgi:hypothetical protein